MTHETNLNSNGWTSVQAYTLAVVCLLAGLASGWFVRGSQSPATTSASAALSQQAAMSQPTPDQLKHMADVQASQLTEKLKSDPNNADLLAQIGNLYYDAQQFPSAIDYYQRSLQVQPSNNNVRTDLATAMWYAGNVDGAVEQFHQVLRAEPNKPNALFNLGIVEWQGKMDVDGAVAAWQKLLDTNPNYQDKDKVISLIAQAKKHSGVKPGTSAKPLS
jgi:cytochrome c-type biogenesis protein CcmH/NrfG